MCGHILTWILWFQSICPEVLSLTDRNKWEERSYPRMSEELLVLGFGGSSTHVSWSQGEGMKFYSGHWIDKDLIPRAQFWEMVLENIL